jgi:integrase/recombinase XerD
MIETVSHSPVGTGRCLRVGEWPRLDQELWARAQQEGGLLDEPSPAAGWALATRNAVTKSYGRWLNWLAINDALDPLAPPEQRATPERIKAYVMDLQARNASNTIHMRILQLGRMLEVLAPGTRLDGFARMLRKLRAARHTVRDDRARLVPVSDLLSLGWALIERAEQWTERSPHGPALHYRNGLLILFLCACPLREASLAILATDHHLKRRGDCWWVVLGRAEMKSRRPFEQPLPAAFTAAIERYLAYWRPILLSRQTVYGAAAPIDAGHFWLSKSGGAPRPKDFNSIVNAVTRRELGRALNPHLFRKLVPTELAIRDPEHVGIAQVVLGHASYETTDQAYNLARALDAARQVQDTLRTLRRDAAESLGPNSDDPHLEEEA